MWSQIYQNRRCNEQEQFYQHKTHLERIVTAKSRLNISEPLKPSFLSNRTKKEQIEKDKNYEINLQNGHIMKKIYELQTHFNFHHPKKIIIKECPALNKKNESVNFKQKFIKEENFVKYNFKKLLENVSKINVC